MYGFLYFNSLYYLVDFFVSCYINISFIIFFIFLIGEFISLEEGLNKKKRGKVNFLN